MVGPFVERGMGSGYFSRLIDAMQIDQERVDELGYTNGFHRFLGESLIRPLAGDEWLIHATDAQILDATVAVSAGVVLLFYFGGAAAATGAAWGAGTSVVFDVAVQIENNLDNGVPWYQIDVGQTFRAAVVGGVTGAVGGALGRVGAFVARTRVGVAAAARLNCQVVTVALRTAGNAQGLHSIYSGVQSLREGDLVAGAVQIAAGALGLRAANRFSACFVAGTEVWLDEFEAAGLAGVEYAGLGLSGDDDAEAEYDLLWTVALAGVAIVGAQAMRRKRRGSDNPRADRDELFARLTAQPDLLQDVPMPTRDETIACDAID
jgi:hypothetical protein